MQNTIAQEMAFQGVPLLLAQQVYSNTPSVPVTTRFNAYPSTDPYAFAAYADLLSAYQELEKATFAVDKRELLLRLEKADDYLEYADDNIKRSTLPQFSVQIESLEEELERLEGVTQALPYNSIALFQTQELRDYITLFYPIVPNLESELASL